LPSIGISRLPNTAEIQMGVVVLVAVAAMLSLLTIMAMIFKQSNLSDRTQALGLPEGSIRALIALLLLMVFVIFSIYLFRQVVGFQWDFFQSLTEDQVNAFAPSDIYAKKHMPDGSYEVWIRIKNINEAGEQFAQQIFTAMLTLVTAVSSFYFASKGETVRKVIPQNEPMFSDLKVTGITPASGEAAKGKIFITNLAGNGFVDGTKVILRRAGEKDLDASEIEIINESRILCTMDLTGKGAGKWDVIAIRPDSKESKLIDGFEIK